MLPVSRGGTEVAMASSWQPIQGGDGTEWVPGGGIVAGLKPRVSLIWPYCWHRRRPFVLAPHYLRGAGGLCGSLP